MLSKLSGLFSTLQGSMVPAGLGPTGFPGQPAGPEAANGLPGQDPSMAPLNGAGQSDGQDPAWRFSDMMQVSILQFVQALFPGCLHIVCTRYRPSHAVVAEHAPAAAASCLHPASSAIIQGTVNCAAHSKGDQDFTDRHGTYVLRIHGSIIKTLVISLSLSQFKQDHTHGESLGQSAMGWKQILRAGCCAVWIYGTMEGHGRWKAHDDAAHVRASVWAAR